MSQSLIQITIEVKQCSVTWCFKKINKGSESKNISLDFFYCYAMTKTSIFFIDCVDPYCWCTVSKSMIKGMSQNYYEFFLLVHTVMCSSDSPAKKNLLPQMLGRLWAYSFQLSAPSGITSAGKAISPRSCLCS